MAEKSSHKTSQLGLPIRDIGSYVLETRNQQIKYLEFEPGTQGGLLMNKKAVPIGWILPPFWRNREGDSSQVTTGDIKDLYSDENPVPDISNINSGGELEVLVWDPDAGDMAPAMTPDSNMRLTLADHNELIKQTNGNGIEFYEDVDPFVGNLLPSERHRVGFSDEFLTGLMELNFPPAHDPEERTIAMLFALKKIARLAEKQGWRLTPISALPHRPINTADVNPNPYIQKISREYMGFSNSRHFVGASWQTHVEMLDLESALAATNRMQEVTPILYAFSLAGPFLNGQINPNLSSNFGDNLEGRNQELKQSTYETLSSIESGDGLSDGIWYSTRYFSRVFGSPSGGVMTSPLPESTEEFYQLASEGLASGDIPAPSRVGAHHGDFRIRPDIGPYGTIEVACLDTFGGHPLKLAAIQEFIRVLGWKLQLMAKRGNLDEAHQHYPALFSEKINAERFREVHNNTIKVAREGTEAELLGADGNTSSISDLYTQLESFVNEPIIDEEEEISFKGLPSEVTRQMQLSFGKPGDSRDYFMDSSQLPSVYGFYETGEGTLSDWLLIRAQSSRQSNPDWTEEQIIADCMRDLGESYHTYLNKLNGYAIKKLFS